MAEDDLEQRLLRPRNYESPLTFGSMVHDAKEAADRLKRYREALEAILVAPLIDHSDATRSAYGIAHQALQNEVKG